MTDAVGPRGLTNDREDGPLGVIVVHGLGDADAGQVVSELIKPFEDAQSAVALEPTYETRVLRPIDDPAEDAMGERVKAGLPSFAVEEEEFAYTQRRGRLTDSPGHRGDVVFGELFWSDTKAGSRSSLPSIFLLLAEILHGHYILGALQRTRGSFFSTASMYFLSWISWLIRGPGWRRAC